LFTPISQIHIQTPAGCQLHPRGGATEQAALLKAIVNADFAILEFAAHRETLEDVFMKVTTGAVQ
jgi:hypothetical protein